VSMNTVQRTFANIGKNEDNSLRAHHNYELQSL